jgi:hypothetical protein
MLSVGCLFVKKFKNIILEDGLLLRGSAGSVDADLNGGGDSR